MKTEKTLENANIPSIDMIEQKVRTLGQKVYKKYYNQQSTFPDEVCRYIAEYIYNEILLPDFEEHKNDNSFWSDNGYCHLNISEALVMKGVFSFIESKT